MSDERDWHVAAEVLRTRLLAAGEGGVSAMTQGAEGLGLYGPPPAPARGHPGGAPRGAVDERRRSPPQPDLGQRARCRPPPGRALLGPPRLQPLRPRRRRARD